MRILLLALLAVAATAHAGIGTTTWSDGPTCRSDGGGWTCASHSERRTGADVDGVGVYLIEQDRWAFGNHSADTPHYWNSSRKAYGVGASVGEGEDFVVLVGLREYRATQEADGKTRSTTDNSVEVDVLGPVADSSSNVGLTNHRVRGSYEHCVVHVLDTVFVDVACGDKALEESPLP